MSSQKNAMLMVKSASAEFFCKVWICGRYLLPVGTKSFDHARLRDYLMPLERSGNQSVVKQKTSFKIYKNFIRIGEKGLLTKVPMVAIPFDRVATAIGFDHLPDVLILGMVEPPPRTPNAPLQGQKSITILQFPNKEAMQHAIRLINQHKQELSPGTGFNVSDHVPNVKNTNNWQLHHDSVEEPVPAPAPPPPPPPPAPVMVPVIVEPPVTPKRTSRYPEGTAVMHVCTDMTHNYENRNSSSNNHSPAPRKPLASTTSGSSVVQELHNISRNEQYAGTHTQIEMGSVVFDDYSDSSHRKYQTSPKVVSPPRKPPPKVITIPQPSPPIRQEEDDLVDCVILDDEPPVTPRIYRPYKQDFDAESTTFTTASEAQYRNSGKVRQIHRQAPYLPGSTLAANGSLPHTSMYQYQPPSPTAVQPQPQPAYYVVKSPGSHHHHHSSQPVMLQHGRRESLKGHVVRPIDQVYFTGKPSKQHKYHHHHHHHPHYYPHPNL